MLSSSTLRLRAARRFRFATLLLLAACGSADGGYRLQDDTVASLNKGGIVSDDFYTGVLDAQVWQVVDPQGDGTVQLVGAGTTDAHLLLSVPAGTKHDAWSTNTSLRVMQPAADEDLEIEVKFESEPTQRHQGQGLLVEQDESNYIRFDVYSNGGQLKVFSAVINNGSASIKVNQSIPSAPVTYLRMGRVGDQWTAQYSHDGSSWTTAASFSHSLTVGSVGVFASNFDPNPAYTAVVDYFFATAAPIVPEDLPPCNPSDQFTLTTQSTDGTLLRDPDQATYACGTSVTLTAQPDPGGSFLGWGGDLSGTTNPDVVTLDGDKTVTASFAVDQTPPQVSGVSVAAGETSATVSWQTDEFSTGSVEYGLSSSYELGAVASPTLATTHVVNVPGLSAGTLYHYRVTASDAFGNSTNTLDATFTTTDSSGGGTGGTAGSGGTGAGTGAIVSDDFYTGVLDAQVWQVVDPQGDGTVQLVGAGTTDAHLLLSVPAGTKHDAWSTNTSLRVMQPAADEDLEIEVKFESEPTQRHQGQGLLVEQDESNYIRFDVYSNGGQLKVFSAVINNGSASIKVNQSIPSAPVTYLRMGRVGDQWTAQYSHDGFSWTTAASFSHSLTVGSVGVFASNFDPNPAYTAVVDYFFATAAPIVPEDLPPCNPSDQFTLTTQSTDGTLLRDPDQATYACGTSVTLTAQPDPGGSFLGWGGDLSGTTNPDVVTLDGDKTVTASFAVDQTPPQVSGVSVAAGETSATVSWQTDEFSTGSVEYGLSSSYELGAVASPTLATTHVVNVPGLSAGTLYHYRVTASDAFGNSTNTLDGVFPTGAPGGGSGGPDIDVWYGLSQVFGKAGIPQRWVNVLGNVRDDDGVSSLTYSLNGAPELPLTLGRNSPRLRTKGDFNVEIAYDDLPPGVSQITLRARDTFGNENLKIVAVEYIDDVVAPETYSIDWSSVTDFSDVAQIVDGKWSLSSDGLRTLEPGYDRVVAMGDLLWTDYEAVVEFTLNAPVDDPSAAPIIGLITRWTGHFEDGQQPSLRWFPFGALLCYLWHDSYEGMALWSTEGVRSLASGPSPPPIPGVKHVFKMRTETLLGGLVESKLRMWRAGDPEPSTWGITYVTSGATAGGSLLFVAHWVDVTLGNVAIVPLGN